MQRGQAREIVRRTLPEGILDFRICIRNFDIRFFAIGYGILHEVIALILKLPDINARLVAEEELLVYPGEFSVLIDELGELLARDFVFRNQTVFKRTLYQLAFGSVDNNLIVGISCAGFY